MRFHSLLTMALLASPLALLASGPAAAQSMPAAEPSASPAQAAPSAVQDSTQLELVHSVTPDYPLEAAAKALQGHVVIRLHISEMGDVKSTEIIGGDPLLANAAVGAMKEWQFKPFIKAGKPVPVSRDVPFDFVLNGKLGDACSRVEAAQEMNASRHPGSLSPKDMNGRIIRRVEPEYPVDARMGHLQGTVILQVVIGKDGRVRDLKALCGRSELIQAATRAVREWRYEPYLVNAQPVEVETTVKVTFRM